MVTRVVQQWTAAFNARDFARLQALTDEAAELKLSSGTLRGHEGLRQMLHRQSYGVSLHVHNRRFYRHEGTVVVAMAWQFRYSDTGEVADQTERAAIFEIRHGRVQRLVALARLEDALHAARLSTADEVVPATRTGGQSSSS